MKEAAQLEGPDPGDVYSAASYRLYFKRRCLHCNTL